jgi:hypothetical protein
MTYGWGVYDHDALEARQDRLDELGCEPPGPEKPDATEDLVVPSKPVETFCDEPVGVQQLDCAPWAYPRCST